MGHSRVIDKDHGWKALYARVREVEDLRAKVGVLADTPEGSAHEEGSDLTVAQIAAVQEFGTEDQHIPERSFVRATFDAMRGELEAMAKLLLTQVLDGKMDTRRALGLMGARLAAAMKGTITAGIDPPNAPATLLAKAKTGKTAGAFRGRARKGLAGLGRALAQAGALAAVKPLIDTARLLGAITWAVFDRREAGRDE